MLNSPLFASNNRLQDAAENNPAIRPGDEGLAVTILQAALIDLGYELPVSVRKTGVPDGIYGRETKEAVRKFQKDQRLKDDGIVGRNTMEKLDEAVMAKSSVPAKSPKAPKRPSIPSNANYTIGHQDPKNDVDAGAGVWNSKPKEKLLEVQKSVMLGAPFRFAFETKVGPDAVEHLMHFLGNSGAHKEIKAWKMVNDSPTTHAAYLNELSQAQQFTEALPEGTHHITSKAVEFTTTALDPSRNWFFAVGGFQYWGSGIAYVMPGPSYKLQFAFKVFDRYNWDGDKAADIPVPGTDMTIEVTDATLAEFHRQGLAREYNQSGSYVKVYEWKPGGATVAPGPYIPPNLK